ncbi:uncharacterized protein KY384_006210 [Bacidia gigantensis]|uniref:uncharacterized protein n=1 Tax=Bacidia gigantensis TaxID=2732470 RepID=UPI001D053F31|nr:uncharacterized protein KY384_006210 [Bacidia gigantensis]KAG8529573.1 hypothetical protein KY384_006210 [Bacidia gigantensis]
MIPSSGTHPISNAAAYIEGSSHSKLGPNFYQEKCVHKPALSADPASFERLYKNQNTREFAPATLYADERQSHNDDQHALRFAEPMLDTWGKCIEPTISGYTSSAGRTEHSSLDPLMQTGARNPYQEVQANPENVGVMWNPQYSDYSHSSPRFLEDPSHAMSEHVVMLPDEQIGSLQNMGSPSHFGGITPQGNQGHALPQQRTDTNSHFPGKYLINDEDVICDRQGYDPSEEPAELNAYPKPTRQRYDAADPVGNPHHWSQKSKVAPIPCSLSSIGKGKPSNSSNGSSLEENFLPKPQAALSKDWQQDELSASQEGLKRQKSKTSQPPVRRQLTPNGKKEASMKRQLGTVCDHHRKTKTKCICYSRETLQEQCKRLHDNVSQSLFLVHPRAI